jgi:hypothetical protein
LLSRVNHKFDQNFTLELKRIAALGLCLKELANVLKSLVQLFFLEIAASDLVVDE